jgi:predicted NBD/HSP70 family sugar kinase
MKQVFNIIRSCEGCQGGPVSGASPGSPAALRHINQARVLAAVRGSEPLRLGEVAETTGLSRPTVASALDELHDAGWVDFLDEHAKGRSGLGRPARLVRFRSEAGYVVGIDIGAHRTGVVVADLAGRPVATLKRSTTGAQDRHQLLAAVRATVHEALAQSRVGRSTVMSVAVGSPGIINPTESMVVQAPSLPGWASLNLAKELRRSFRCPVQVENDVNLAVLGECWRGAARSARTVVFVLWGERVGAGIFVDGHLHRGAAGAAGELGYLSVLDPSSKEVLIDEHGLGPFERAVGAGAIVGMGRQASRRAGGKSELARAGDELDAALVFSAAAAGDRTAGQVVEAVIARLARGLAPLLLVLDPDILVIGGGVSRAGQAVLDALRLQVHRLTLVDTPLELSQLGEDAVAIGAVRLALTDAEQRVLPSL